MNDCYVELHICNGIHFLTDTDIHSVDRNMCVRASKNKSVERLIELFFDASFHSFYHRHFRTSSMFVNIFPRKKNSSPSIGECAWYFKMHSFISKDQNGEKII